MGFVMKIPGYGLEIIFRNRDASIQGNRSDGLTEFESIIGRTTMQFDHDQVLAFPSRKSWSGVNPPVLAGRLSFFNRPLEGDNRDRVPPKCQEGARAAPAE